MKQKVNPEQAATPAGANYSEQPRESTAKGSEAQGPVHPSHPSPHGAEPTSPKRRQSYDEWKAADRKAAKERAADYEKWLERGSERLEHSWVSVCPYAESHDVKPYRLTEIVDLIRSGGSVAIETKWGEKNVNIAENQEKVRRLYTAGVREAQKINRLRIIRLLEQLGLSADPDAVAVIPLQPKGNEKLCFIEKVIVDGKEYDVRAKVGNVVFHRPHDLGKAKADEAKKRTPGVTLAGVFLPQRNKVHLIRATGLYPLDLDGVEKVEETRIRIREDPHAVVIFGSITGSGLRVCAFGPAARDADEYERLYKQIAAAKSKAWRLEAKIDKATFDCSRLTFLPYDPQISFDA